MRRQLFLTFCVLLAGANPAAAQPVDFETCARALAAEAKVQGIDATTVDEVFRDIQQLPRVVAQDRAQPEFTSTFTEYYNRRVTANRVDQGRQLYQEHASLLDQIQRATGVPAQYLVALWGLETNYGSFFGDLPIPSALATLACDSRRAKFFNRELMAVLRIIAAGDLNAKAVRGSWAGAIGHMQFMPTTYLAHAKDGDGDGRKDLFESLADALTSGGHYLSDLGWQPGYRWGREVRLPADFDYASAGFDQWHSLAHWREAGVTTTAGEPLAAIDLKSAIVLPSGHQGPAFVVYPNFRIIMGWNRSINYALAVARLADRIAGAGRLHQALPDPKDSRVRIADIKRLQAHLNQKGYDAGKPDGIVGTATRRALRAYQQSQGLVADGYPNAEVLQTLKRTP